MNNKQISYRYRSEVLLLLHERGFHGATRPPEPKGPDKLRTGSIIGLPVTTAVRASQTLDLSGALIEAQLEAEAEHNDVYVTVQARRGKPVGQSYVVTDLDTWLNILARLHPEAVSSTTPPLAQAGG